MTFVAVVKSFVVDAKNSTVASISVGMFAAGPLAVTAAASLLPRSVGDAVSDVIVMLDVPMDQEKVRLIAPAGNKAGALALRIKSGDGS